MVNPKTVSPAFCFDKDKAKILNTKYWKNAIVSGNSDKEDDGAGGVWSDGIWFEGEWNAGTWYNGMWVTGVWKGGSFMDGVWCSGLWWAGNWVNGCWCSGVWDIGIWWAGEWISGRWNKGNILKEIRARDYVFDEIKISPKSYHKPNRTLSLNYAKYN